MSFYFRSKKLRANGFIFSVSVSKSLNFFNTYLDVVKPVYRSDCFCSDTDTNWSPSQGSLFLKLCYTFSLLFKINDSPHSQILLKTWDITEKESRTEKQFCDFKFETKKNLYQPMFGS